MKRWAFHYHFKYALVKHAAQSVTTGGQNWTVAAARADRQVIKRPGIKGKRKMDIFTRVCYPVVESGLEILEDE